MGKIFLVSDTHFAHKNIIAYCRRGFRDLRNHDLTLIERWNRVVAPEDTVYHLGDFVMGDSFNVYSYLTRLNGHIILVRGNHDTKGKIEIYERNFPGKIEVHDIAYLSFERYFLIMCHFPILSPEYAAMVTQNNNEVIVCHGHVHDQLPFFNPETRTFNLSADVIDFTPVEVGTIVDVFKKSR